MGESAGEHAKFGLSTAEILEAAKILKEAGMSSAFKLLHFHIGSQVPDILIIKRAVREAARYYAKLRELGHPIEYLDVGGGLAIDYDGSRSTFHALDELLARGVRARRRLQHRRHLRRREGAASAHRLGVGPRHRRAPLGARRRGLRRDREARRRTASTSTAPASTSSSRTLDDIAASTSTTRNLAESWHDLLQMKEEAQKMFELGLLELDVKAQRRDRSSGRSPSASQKHRRASSTRPKCPTTSRDLANELADQHICNFSVFQSLLDHWALGALFPIVPIHRLDERPTLESTLVDITCDSDGKVAKFIDLQRRARHARRCTRSTTAALLPRHLPDRRLPGHHGRHPQPLRPRERGPRLPR